MVVYLRDCPEYLNPTDDIFKQTPALLSNSIFMVRSQMSRHQQSAQLLSPSYTPSLNIENFTFHCSHNHVENFEFYFIEVFLFGRIIHSNTKSTSLCSKGKYCHECNVTLSDYHIHIFQRFTYFIHTERHHEVDISIGWSEILIFLKRMGRL